MTTTADIDLAYTPALEQAALLRDRRVTSVELTQLYLRRIEEHNPRLGHFLTVVGDQALEAARTADQLLATNPEDAPPFCGVPTSIKDLVDTAGIRTTHGTAAFADRVPTHDAEVVQRIRAAGFVILGKTNTPEFGMAPVTEPPAYPPARNPWDPDRTTGGSSGGAAGAVAAGLCPIAHGSDGGGSIRVPASICGVVGLKPSRGRITNAPEPQHLFATEGPIGRTVADVAAFLDVMAGPNIGDAFSAPPPPRAFLDEVGAPPGRLRIAWTDTPFIEGIATEPAQRHALDGAVALLADLGHDLEEARPDWDASLTTGVVTIFAAELAAWPELPPLDTLDPWTRLLIERVANASAPDIARAERNLALACRKAMSFFEHVDVLVTPTLPIATPRIGEFKTMSDEPEGVMRYSAMSAFTAAFNLTGQPAISLPLATADDGLPAGIHLVGRADEATLLRLASQIETARPWADRHPQIS